MCCTELVGFALWIDQQDGLAWAQGTHEYRPMGMAVIASTDRFRHRDFRQTRKRPKKLENSFADSSGHSKKSTCSYIAAPDGNRDRLPLICCDLEPAPRPIPRPALYPKLLPHIRDDIHSNLAEPFIRVGLRIIRHRVGVA